MTAEHIPLKLLLAEDDPLQRMLLGRMLTRAGYAVDTTTDGVEALERILAGQFHFLITDWDMPSMDGATLCRRVRAAQLPDYIYILMLTGHTAEADLLKAFDAGADDYVKKPANEAELLARVKAGCRLIESERRLSAALAQVRELSITDPLTGLYNRRYLNEQLPHEIERAHRYARPLSVIMADLDAFKLLNDTHGHATGDEVLQGFAQVARTSIRAASDWIARYGGEEFLVVLPETTLTEAAKVAEKIRTQCNHTPINTHSGPRRVTASFGVAAAPRPQAPPTTMETLLRHCDEALYRSKRAGRDCVTLASESSSM